MLEAPAKSYKFKRDCPICNKEIQYPFLSDFKLAEGRNSSCKSCRTSKANRSNNRSSVKEKNPSWKGYLGVGNSWFSKYFSRSGRRGKLKTGTITIIDAYNQLEKQGFKCALTGIPLAWTESSGMSIDRIDSNKMYELDNIQIVHKDVNIMKNQYDQDYFINVCKLVTKNFEVNNGN